MPESQIHKDKKWLFFALGLIAGFIICAAFAVISEMSRDKSKSFTQTIRHIYLPENASDTVVKYVYLDNSKTKSKPHSEPEEPQDSLATDDQETEYDEADFFLSSEDNEEEDVVVTDKVIASKSIKIQYKDADFQDIKTPEGEFAYLDVQQWNTPIKNRISYQYGHKLLKIKGLSIDKISIINYEHHFYIHYGNSYYLLTENTDFERLVKQDLTDK